MLTSAPLPFALLLSAFLHLSLAAPPRAHCRCAIITPDSLLTAQDADLLSITTPNSADPCASLGPDLEYFRREDPELYRAYVNPGNPEVTPTSDSLKPLTTAVLMDYAMRNGFSKASPAAQEGKSASADQGMERIVCHSEPEDFTAYKSSTMGLYALHIIIAIAVLACVVEGVSLIKSWFTPDTNKVPRLQLPGGEQTLKAFSTSDVLFSPGIEKKAYAYSKLDLVLHTGEKRISNAYVVNIRLEYDEDDDEMSRPVM